MPHSFATTANLTCTACTQPFTAELWLIVDTVERPDLLARIREGVLHDVPCPHCGATNRADAPLLAYRPDREPTLVFTPRWASDDATQQADAQGLLDTLKANLGAAWDDRWLAEADTLPAVATSAPAAVGQTDVLFHTLIELINAPSWDESQRIVEAHPALLSDAADALLARLADAQDDEEARRAVTAHRELLRRCKSVGIARAFAEQNGGQQHRPEITPALHPFINELTQLTERGDMPRRIALCRQALDLVERSTNPQLWAALQVELGNSLAQNLLDNRAANLEQAIASYEQALQVTTRTTMPIEWAEAMNNLAAAYVERIRGERVANLEQAIAAYEQALQVRTRTTMPIEWAQTMMNLANAYAERIRGERAANLEQAIAAYEQAFQVTTRTTMPIEWAKAMMNLANVYVERIRGERAANLERAIAAYEQALAIRTKDALPADYRTTQRNLGCAYLTARQWANAEMALQEALAINELLYAAAATPEARQAELRAISDVPAALAYALAQQQESGGEYLAAAAVTLERNRARWLAESIALRRTQPVGVADVRWQHFLDAAETMRMLQSESQLADNTPSKRDFLTLTPLLAAAREALQTAIAQVREQAPDFMPEPSFAELQATVTNGNAIVYLLTTEQGGLALILHAGGVESVWLDVTDAQVREWLGGPDPQQPLGGWLGAYRAWLR